MLFIYTAFHLSPKSICVPAVTDWAVTYDCWTAISLLQTPMVPCLSLAMRGPVVSICTLTPTHAHIHTNTHTHTQLSQPETSKLCKFLLWWCAGCGPLSRSHTHKLFSGFRYRWGKAFCVCVCCMWIVLNWKEFTDNSAWTLHRHGQCCGSMWRISISSSGTGTNPQFVCSAITWQQSCHWYDL